MARTGRLLTVRATTLGRSSHCVLNIYHPLTQGLPLAWQACPAARLF